MKILFQGDSITDAGRDKENCHNLGNGYPKYAAELIKKNNPDTDFEFVNLGIGGHQTKDLVARLDKDFIDIQPDIVSILVGVNDTWHHAEKQDWISEELFEENYRIILTAIKERTNAKIMILEPFLGLGKDKAHFRVDMDRKIHVIRKLAREFAEAYVPLDGLFASEFVNNNHFDYMPDSVHPSNGVNVPGNTRGAEFIAAIYADYIQPIIDGLKFEH